MKIGKKSAILFAIDLIILMMAVGICAADEVHVYPGKSIQTAVDNAAQGDIIIVHNGTYVENIDVNKELTIVSDSGDPSDTIIHAFTFKDDVFDVTADNVTISGLTIEGAYGDRYAAIRLGADGVDSGKYNCLITDNILTNNYYGVKVLNWSHENEFNNNIIISNIVGISMDAHSQESSFIDNTIELNSCCGIIIRNYHMDHTFVGNTITNNGDGIHFYYGSGSVLTDNIIDSNDGYGIDISRSSDMTLINNRFSGNSKGILFNGFGAHKIYDNYFNNTQNLDTIVYNGSTTATVWNTTRAVGTNMIGGPYLGGNYWATPGGTGFSQITADADGDGICDLPCVIDENNTDYLPLSLQPFELMPPIADFASNVTSGYAPLAVQFTDESANNVVSWEWNFGDGSLLSNETNPVHLYAEPGTYNVSLTVGNANGNDTELRTNYILVEANPADDNKPDNNPDNSTDNTLDSSLDSSKRSGGGSGGSVGSPTFREEVVVLEELVVVEETVPEEPLNTIVDDTVADEVPEEPKPSSSKLLLGFIAPLAIGVIAYLKRDELLKWLKK